MRAREVVRILGRTLAALAFTAVLPAAAHAQTVSPVIVEHPGTAFTGSFELRNDSMESLMVTLEPKSFSIDTTGKGSFRKLDDGIRVTFSETSLSLPPRSHRTVIYKAQAEVYPAWFSVYATFHGLPKQNGVNMLLELPHTVYMLGDRKRAHVHDEDVVFDQLQLADGTLAGTVRNVSPRMLRVTSLDAAADGHHKEHLGGFPLLPGGEYHFTVPFAAADQVRLEAHFGENGSNKAQAVVGHGAAVAGVSRGE